MAKKGENGNETFGTLDFETDPFQIGRVPMPFACGVYFARNDYFILWDADSKSPFLSRCARALGRLPACTLYAHNGGKFDFHYLLEYAAGKNIVIRNGRIVQMKIGRVTLKDSFPLMPFPLAEYRKTPIDYAIFERWRRNKPANRRKIEAYLLDDCADLHELLTGFRALVGTKDTIGSASFVQMRAMGLKIQSLNETHDDMFRPFYFGGRVQAFEGGMHRGPFKYLDINSAYPFAMRAQHAHGGDYRHARKLPKGDALGTCFVRCIAKSRGALPLRAEDGRLSFPETEAEFYATGHEIAAGLETKTLEIKKILDVWIPRSFICFREYVEKYYALRLDAKRTGDLIRALAYKYLLNSGYGKFAQNPRDFKEYRLAPYGRNVRGFDWETDFGEISLWSRPSFRGWGFYDVATGASITGYVRAMLWRAICASRGVLYVDTDSMICRTSTVTLGDALGAWKVEGTARRVAIAGKKLYGVEWDKPIKGERHRVASKGARLEWSELVKLCQGRTIIWENDAPTFSINGAHFIKREIRAT